MKKLLSIEWLKLKDYNPFKVLSIFFVFGIVLVNVIVYQANKSIIEESLPKGQMFSFHPYDFANTWQTTSYATGFLLVLPAMLLIILVTTSMLTAPAGRISLMAGAVKSLLRLNWHWRSFLPL